MEGILSLLPAQATLMLQPAVRPATGERCIRLYHPARRLTGDNYGIVSQRRPCISNEICAAATPAKRERNSTVGKSGSHVGDCRRLHYPAASKRVAERWHGRDRCARAFRLRIRAASRGGLSPLPG